MIRCGLTDSLVAFAATKADGFVQVAATFSFSMMGFMAAVMALFSIVGQSRAFKRYRENGFLKVLLMGIAITLIELAFTFVASLQLFVRAATPESVTCVMLALLASLGMVVATSVPIVGLQIRAASEKN
jgi:hypothetical protein